MQIYSNFLIQQSHSTEVSKIPHQDSSHVYWADVWSSASPVPLPIPITLRIIWNDLLLSVSIPTYLRSDGSYFYIYNSNLHSIHRSLNQKSSAFEENIQISRSTTNITSKNPVSGFKVVCVYLLVTHRHRCFPLPLSASSSSTFAVLNHLQVSPRHGPSSHMKTGTFGAR